MSGVTGAERVKSRQDYERFVASYLPLIKQFPGFVSLNKSGSYNSDPNKQNFGDIDLIAHIQSDQDKATTKKQLVKFFEKQPDTTIVPFTSVKHPGKRTYNSGEIVTVRYHDDEMGYSVQIDNIIAADEGEVSFKQHFLDMPAEKQGLVLGLVKVATIETAPAILFKKLGINASTELGPDQEYEFNLSSVKLELRKVTYEQGTFKQLDREIIWSSQNWEDLQKLLYQYDLNSSFEELLNKTKQVIKNPRSSQRIQGVFASMITVKSGEVGTAKGAGKEAALDKIRQTFSENKKQIRLFNALLETAGQDTMVFAFGRFQIPTNGHKLLIDKVKTTAQQHHADYAIFVSKKVGDTTATKYANPLSIDQKMPYITKAFPGVNFVPCNEQMGTIIHIAQHINQKYKKIIMVAGRDRMEGKLNFKELLEKQNGIDFHFDDMGFVAVDRDPDAESSSQMKEFVKQDDWDSFRRDLPSTLDDRTAHQLWEDLKINLAPVPRKSRKTKEGGYGDNGSPESRRPGVGSANYVSMPGGIGIQETRRMSAAEKLQRAFEREREKSKGERERAKKYLDAIMPDKKPDHNKEEPAKEAMLPKSVFPGSNKNKLGSAGQLKGNMKRPARAGDLVGGGCEEGIAEAREEEYNYDLWDKRFNHTQEIGDYTYNAKTDIDDQEIFITITALDNNKKIGSAIFASSPYNNKMESIKTTVLPEYRGKGVAATMYAYLRMLGTPIAPSEIQSKDGEKMWKKWREKGDAKYLTKEASEKVNEDAMMGKIEATGKIVRILRKQHSVPFSEQKNWLLIDTDPAMGNRGLGIKWIPADTRFSWVRPYRETVAEAIGPHNGKELELMIKGKKPAALIFPHEMAEWRPYIEKFGWIVTPFKAFANYDSFAISKDAYSGKQISQLFQQVIASGRPPTDSFHEKLGRLLGYSEQDISDFLSNKDKKTAQVPVNEDIERIMAGYIKILASK